MKFSLGSLWAAIWHEVSIGVINGLVLRRRTMSYNAVIISYNPPGAECNISPTVIGEIYFHATKTQFLVQHIIQNMHKALQ